MHKNQCCVMRVKGTDLPVKFGARRSVNDREVAQQTHTMTFLKF